MKLYNCGSTVCRSSGMSEFGQARRARRLEIFTRRRARDARARDARARAMYYGAPSKRVRMRTRARRESSANGANEGARGTTAD